MIAMKSPMIRLLLLLTIGTFAAFTCAPARAAGADEGGKAAKPGAEAPMEGGKEPAKPSPAPPEEPKLTVTQHSVVIGGKTISYKATVGYLLLKQEAGDTHPAKPDDADKKPPGGDGQKDDLKPWAKIFFIAYTRDGMDPATRPVTFAFNGGPGAASVWLHLGALGPRRVKLTGTGDGPSAPPYSLVDNESSWLDDTDLVFIDPVSTGYSRPAAGESAQAFHGYEADIKSVAEFIRLYITRNREWPAPKFIIGESYGGARAGGLSAYLQNHLNIYVNGVIIVSGLLNAQTIDANPGNDLPYSLFLPGYAATAWYHKKLPPEQQARSAEEVRKEAEEFAAREYPLALMQGNALPEAAQKEIAAKMSALTGLPVDLILRYHLRIPAGVFRDELLKADNRVLGRFDSRVTGIGYDPDGNYFDPSFEAVKGAFTATINDYLRNDLKFETDVPYETLAPISWNSGSENRYLEVEQALSGAMSQNPSMKVWVTAGYYDMAIAYSATQYAVRQLLVDPALRPNLSLTLYEGGHMMYNNAPARKQFKADFETFLENTLHPKAGR